MSAQINQLNTELKINDNDLLPIYSSQNGDTRKISLNALAVWLSSKITMQDNKITQYSTPISASALLVDDMQKNVWLILTPLSTLSSLTIKLPLLANTINKQELLINTTQTITSLTIDTNGASIIGAPTTLTANQYFKLRYDLIMKTWYKVG